VALRKIPRHLTWLESFLAAVEAGSLDGAAQHLGVSRSVISEHLASLEEVVAGGAPLVERGPGRKLQLTKAGERLYEAVRDPMHALDVRRLKAAASTAASLRLGLNPVLGTLWLGALCTELARAGIALEVSFGGAIELVRKVQARQLDLALGFTPLPSRRGVDARAILDLPFVVLAPSNGAFAAKYGKRRRLEVAHLAGARFVDWLRDDPYGGANAQRFAHASIEVQEVARVESFLHLFPALVAYEAVGIAPDLSRLAPFPSELRAWPLAEDAPQAVSVVAMTPSGGASVEAVRALETLTSMRPARTQGAP
jgi:DNA-binding transcriptional LysR family regulator